MSCSPQTVCALRESAVNLICSYSTTTKPQQSFWFSPKLKAKWRNEADPEDLALDSDYAGRVRYTETGSSSTLTITDLRERDSGEYQLMIITGVGERSLSSAVRLTVSGVFDENCWNVRYSDRRLCVVEGSSVDFLCTYSHPSHLTVNDTFWHYEPKVNPKDLSLDDRFAGRVEFLGDKEGNCTLRMRDVRKNDSGEYHFRFITNTGGGRFSGKPGVILHVTDLQVRVSPSSPSEGQTVTLTCSSTCTLPNNPTYMWYKNREPVTNKPTKYNKLYLESASSEDIHLYSCALGSRGRST
ncbi:sialoadhesin-like [Colossoma macropomum]|uniref:sialoadhesin-like n=1 Tax=Colossoma macropomum TaxID=42526 RepID=UPI0018646D3B|nr:sialoadhesin-like [Colossoma macropomum]